MALSDLLKQRTALTSPLSTALKPTAISPTISGSALLKPTVDSGGTTLPSYLQTRLPAPQPTTFPVSPLPEPQVYRPTIQPLSETTPDLARFRTTPSTPSPTVTGMLGSIGSGIMPQTGERPSTGINLPGIDTGLPDAPRTTERPLPRDRTIGIGNLPVLRPEQVTPPRATPPPVSGALPPQAQGNAQGLEQLFKFFKQDLENARQRSLGQTRASAANRGVFYGTPLTTSEGDIETSFLRGLGQLQSGIFQGEQQNELARLGLASNLLGQLPQQFQGPEDATANAFTQLGALFGPRANVAGAASLPQIGAPLPKLPAGTQPFRPALRSGSNPFRTIPR